MPLYQTPNEFLSNINDVVIHNSRLFEFRAKRLDRFHRSVRQLIDTFGNIRLKVWRKQYLPISGQNVGSVFSVGPAIGARLGLKILHNHCSEKIPFLYSID